MPTRYLMPDGRLLPMDDPEALADRLHTAEQVIDKLLLYMLDMNLISEGQMMTIRRGERADV